MASIKEAARRLGLPTDSLTGAPTWGGHSLRRGGAQYFGEAGVDVWRIQALARHSSTAILRYLADSHIPQLTHLAAEAALARDLRALREELRRHNVATQAPPPAPAPAGPGADSPTAADLLGDWVLTQGGRLHMRHQNWRDHTVCGWEFTRSRNVRVLLSDSEGPALAALRCVRCARHVPSPEASPASSASSS